jgi:hypothetical protein
VRFAWASAWIYAAAALLDLCTHSRAHPFTHSHIAHSHTCQRLSKAIGAKKKAKEDATAEMAAVKAKKEELVTLNEETAA